MVQERETKENNEKKISTEPEKIRNIRKWLFYSNRFIKQTDFIFRSFHLYSVGWNNKEKKL